jgi:hypothetical protein
MKLSVPYPFAGARRVVGLVVFAAVVGVCVWHVAAPAANNKTLSAAPRHTRIDCPDTFTPNDSHSIEAYHHFDVPAGQFQETLECFMNQSGLAVGWDGTLAPEKVETRATGKKRMRSVDALVWMLSGSKLEVVPSSDERDTALWLVRRTERQL